MVMTEHQTSRTLVKSAPELWAECSDAASLARHLGSFGEIRITKLEPETAVAWEGAAVRGSVRLEPSGWGTRVTLTVTEEDPVVAAEPDPAVEALEVAVAVAVAAEAEAEGPAGTEREAPADAEPRADADAEPRADAGAEPRVPAGAEPEPDAVHTLPRPGMLARMLLALRRRPPAEPVAAREPDAAEEPAADDPGPDEPQAAQVVPPAPDPPGERTGEDALAAALDSLGRAHHRPYSRA